MSGILLWAALRQTGIDLCVCVCVCVCVRERERERERECVCVWCEAALGVRLPYAKQALIFHTQKR